MLWHPTFTFVGLLFMSRDTIHWVVQTLLRSLNDCLIVTIWSFNILMICYSKCVFGSIEEIWVFEFKVEFELRKYWSVIWDLQFVIAIIRLLHEDFNFGILFLLLRLVDDSISPTWNSLTYIVQVSTFFDLVSWGEFNITFFKAPGYSSNLHFQCKLIIEQQDFIHVSLQGLSYCSYNPIYSVVKVSTPDNRIKRNFLDTVWIRWI